MARRWVKNLGMAAILVLASMLSGQDAPPPPRLPEPSAEAQRESEKMIREVFKEEYAKKSAADQKALARKLLQQGTETRDDAASRFVLFREARNLAAEAGDLETAFGAILEMAKVFQVDNLGMKGEVLEKAAKAARMPEACGELARAYLKLAGEALEGEAFDAARKATREANTLARKSKDLRLVAEVGAREKEMGEREREHAKIKAAREKLIGSPEDPEANLMVGKCECLVKGNWELGLPMLVKASDPKIKSAAEKDLSRPTEAAEQAALGDTWWELAEKNTGMEKTGMMRRAVYWYMRAVPSISGLNKARIEKRLSSMPPIIFKEVVATGLQGHWTFDDKMGALAADASGNGNHGSLTGVTWTTGVLSGALEFHGNGYVLVKDSPNLNPPRAIALAAWVYGDRWRSSNVILEKGVAAHYQYVLECSADNQLRFGLRGIGDIRNAAPPLGQWHHVAGTYDGAMMRMYIDGMLVGEAAAAGKIFASPEPLYIGSRYDTAPPIDFFDGRLDDVRIYDRALPSYAICYLAAR